MHTLIADRQTEYFWKLVKEHNIHGFFHDSYPPELVEIIVVRTVTNVNEQFLKNYPNLKMIIRAGAGIDNIDVKYAASKGIIVCNTPEANVLSTYEHTLSFIFAMIKQHQIAKANILNNLWKEKMNWNLEIGDLQLLVVGVGRIGTRVARTMKCLGAQVMGVDPYLSTEEWDEKGVRKVNYLEGIKEANLITYHCPLTEETTDYFSFDTLERITKPVYLVNTARGKIINEDALRQGLQSGKIIAAALDVFENEPHPQLPFADAGNVYLTPHNGAFTQAAKRRLSEEIITVWKEYVYEGKIRRANLPKG